MGTRLVSRLYPSCPDVAVDVVYFYAVFACLFHMDEVCNRFAFLRMLVSVVRPFGKGNLPLFLGHFERVLCERDRR